MRKFFMLPLALAMIISIAACSGEKVIDETDVPDVIQEDIQKDIQEDVQEDIQEDVQEDIQGTEDSVVETPADENEDSEDEIETDAPDDSEIVSEPEEGSMDSSESLFDVSWASNEFEKLIPQPPFTGWEGKMLDDNVYEISTSQANADGSGAYYAEFRAYLESLKNYDFSVDGDEYSAIAFDAMGNEIRFKCGDGWAWITFVPVNEVSSGVDNAVDEPENKVVSFDTSWANNDMERLIPEPPMVIARSYSDGGSWIITNRISDVRLADQPRFEVTQDVTRVQALEYLDLLRSLGFIEKSPVYENKTEIEDAIGAFFLTPDERFSITIWHKNDYNMTISIVAVG